MVRGARPCQTGTGALARATRNSAPRQRKEKGVLAVALYVHGCPRAVPVDGDSGGLCSHVFESALKSRACDGVLSVRKRRVRDVNKGKWVCVGNFLHAPRARSAVHSVKMKGNLAVLAHNLSGLSQNERSRCHSGLCLRFSLVTPRKTI